MILKCKYVYVSSLPTCNPFTFIGSFLLQLNKIDIFLSSDGRRSISNRDITFNFPWVSIIYFSLSVKLHFLSSQFVPTAELLSCTKFYFSIISALAGPSHHGPSCSWCRWSPMSPVELSMSTKFRGSYHNICLLVL